METEVVCGVDEAGRGALAGPVVAAAVILGTASLEGIRDSKLMSESQREEIAARIAEECVDFAYGIATVGEIGEANILNASLGAMQRAVGKIVIVPDRVLVDGNRCPELPYRSEAIVDGDATVPAISAASILAKVERDRIMRELALEHPLYGFERHKGYGTQEHLEALERHGVLPCHRVTFTPVRRVIEGAGGLADPS